MLSLSSENSFGPISPIEVLAPVPCPYIYLLLDAIEMQIRSRRIEKKRGRYIWDILRLWIATQNFWSKTMSIDFWEASLQYLSEFDDDLFQVHQRGRYLESGHDPGGNATRSAVVHRGEHD